MTILRTSPRGGDRGRVPLAAAVACWLAHAAAAAGPTAMPLAPAPEELRVDSTVASTAFEPVTTGRHAADAPLPLATAPADGPARRTPIRPLGDWPVLVAIAVAFTLLAALRWRSMHRARPLPPDVFELLGEVSLGGQHAVRVVRFGPRTLLVGVSSAGCRTLAEIDDPQATERITAACRGDRQPVRAGGRRAAPPAAPGSAQPASGEAA